MLVFPYGLLSNPRLLSRSSMGLTLKRRPMTTGTKQQTADILQRAGVTNLVLPLTPNEKCAFPLYPSKTVHDLVEDIRFEDKASSLIVLTDFDGNRISHVTPIWELIKNPFIISIDEEKYSVHPTEAEVVRENILSTQELQELTLRAYYQKIRTQLDEQKRHHMPFSEYQSWCDSYGLSTEQASELSKALHKAGIILHFHQNEDLKSGIFLKPHLVTNALVQILELKYMNRSVPELKLQLQKLLQDYIPLNQKKLQLDLRAEKRAKWWMRGALGYLAIQFSILARMVWIDFNWDIMEPITYFVGVSTMLGGYIFFVLFGEEYTYKALENRQKKLALRKLYISEGFNWERWNGLHVKTEALKQLLGDNLEKEPTQTSENK